MSIDTRGQPLAYGASRLISTYTLFRFGVAARAHITGSPREGFAGEVSHLRNASERTKLVAFERSRASERTFDRFFYPLARDSSPKIDPANWNEPVGSNSLAEKERRGRGERNNRKIKKQKPVGYTSAIEGQR